MPFYAGDVLRFTATFTDAASGTPVNPTKVTFAYAINNTTSTVSIHFGGTLPPYVTAFSNPATGSYEIDIDTTGLNGTWNWLFASQGGHQVIGDLQTTPVSPPGLAGITY